mmetsp:Transcript_27338/g.55038  ORF Transcript_27338/g.55038 Transcript_27338/m.55038 type:complete len:210 (+) Transcript_27338:204-833(+)
MATVDQPTTTAPRSSTPCTERPSLVPSSKALTETAGASWQLVACENEMRQPTLGSNRGSRPAGRGRVEERRPLHDSLPSQSMQCTGRVAPPLLSHRERAPAHGPPHRQCSAKQLAFHHMRRTCQHRSSATRLRNVRRRRGRCCVPLSCAVRHRQAHQAWPSLQCTHPLRSCRHSVALQTRATIAVLRVDRAARHRVCLEMSRAARAGQR